MHANRSIREISSGQYLTYLNLKMEIAGSCCELNIRWQVQQDLARVTVDKESSPSLLLQKEQSCCIARGSKTIRAD